MIVNRVSLNSFNNYCVINKVGHSKSNFSKINNNGLDTVQFVGLQERAQERKINRVHKQLGSALELDTLKDAKAVLDYFEIPNQIRPDGFIDIKGDYPFSYKNVNINKKLDNLSDYGVDEDRLFKFIKRVDGSVYFDDTGVTNTGALEIIKRDAYFEKSNVSKIPNLKYIGRDLEATRSKLKSLENIEYVGGNLKVSFCDIEDFGKVRYVGQGLFTAKSKAKNIGHIETVGGSVFLENSSIEDITGLKHVGGSIEFSDSKVKNADSLVYVGGNVNFENSEVESAKNLSYVGGNLSMENAPITDLSSLSYVGGTIRGGNPDLFDGLFVKDEYRKEIFALPKIKFNSSGLF